MERLVNQRTGEARRDESRRALEITKKRVSLENREAVAVEAKAEEVMVRKRSGGFETNQFVRVGA